MKRSTNPNFRIRANLRNTISLALLATLCAAMAQRPAYAQNFTISNGQTVLVKQTMANPGDKGVVEQGGTLIATVSNAVRFGAAHQSFQNSGTIKTTAAGLSAIFSLDANSRVFNMGTLEAVGVGSGGIALRGTNGIVENSGTITASGVGASGVILDEKGTLKNTGTIAANGTSSLGVLGFSSNLIRIENSGLISAVGSNANAVNLNASNSTIINSGTITSNGNASAAVLVSGNASDSTLTNTGTILAEGSGAKAVISTKNLSVTNSGRIMAPDGYAIQFLGNHDNTLTVQQGSVIRGGLSLGPGTDTLNVSKGISAWLLFDQLPEVINTNGAPFITNGTEVAVLDTSIFGMAENAAFSAVNGALGTLADQNRSHERTEQSNVSAFAAATDPWPAGDAYQASPSNNHVWMRGFGGFRHTNANNTPDPTNQILGGLSIGVDGKLSDDFYLGIFGSGIATKLNTQNNMTEVNASGGLVGLYGGYEDWLDFAVSAGVLGQTSSRQVLNNQIAGGVETITGNFNSYFVAPEVTLSGPKLDLGGIGMLPSLRTRYIWQHIDTYTETGSPLETASRTNLTVDARDRHIIDGRLQFAFGLVETPETLFELQVGADGQLVLGSDTVSATMIGQKVTFGSGGPSNSIGAFVGLTANHKLSENTDLFATAEIGTSTATTFRADAEASIRIKF